LVKTIHKIDWNSEETAALPDLGLEVEVVEKYQSVKGGLEGIVVGHVLTCVPHPDADRLKITTVDLGDGVPVKLYAEQLMWMQDKSTSVATIGTVLYDATGVAFTIKKGKFVDKKVTE
jgi:phenylalanyl-tRNA synthetase beta chain